MSGAGQYVPANLTAPAVRVVSSNHTFHGEIDTIMKVVVTGKQIDVGDALRSHVSDRLTSSLGKYFNGSKLEAAVTFSRDGHLLRADCNVHAGHDMHLQSHGDAPDIYAAFDSAADRIEKRLRRYKRRVQDHHKRRLESAAMDWNAASYVLAANDTEEEQEHEVADGWQPLIVAETTTAIPELSVGEAVMRMDLGDAPAIMFRNRANGQFNVVFRRKDGNIGWIDPANSKTGT